MIEQEDRQDIEVPILMRDNNKKYDHHELLPTTYDLNYML